MGPAQGDDDELEKLIKSTDKKHAKMEKLLELLTEYGQLVAISMMLGGRIAFHTDTDLPAMEPFLFPDANYGMVSP
jgi:hypothetical protein